MNPRDYAAKTEAALQAIAIGGGRSVDAGHAPLMPVDGALDRQSQALGRLHELLIALDVRLRPVLAPQPVTTGAGNLQTPTAAPLLISDRIQERARGIEHAGDLVADMLNRLEL